MSHQTVVVWWMTPGHQARATQGVGQRWPSVTRTWRSSDSDRQGPTHLFVGPLSCSRNGRLAALRSLHKRGCQAHAYHFRQEGMNENTRPIYWSAGNIFVPHVRFCHPRCELSGPGCKSSLQDQSSVASKGRMSILSERRLVRATGRCQMRAAG